MPSERLLSLARQADRLHEEFWKERFGLTLREGVLIGIVGDEKEIGMAETQAALNLGRAGLAAVIEKLIQRGVMTRCKSTQDRRVTHVVLTRQGRTLYEVLRKRTASLNDAWIAALSRQERETFEACLSVLTERARQMA